MNRKKYKECIELLDENFAYFITHILNIGQPRSSELIPTACVALMKDKDGKEAALKDFVFLFNPEFEKKLSISDQAFVLAHETMHVLLNHLRLIKRFPQTTELQKQKFQLAADACINSYLIDCGLDEPEFGCITGQNLVGYNAAHATVSQVYDDIKDEDVEKYIGDCFDDHTWIIVSDEELEKLLNKLDKDGSIPMPTDLQEMKNDVNGKKFKLKVFNPNKQAGKGQTGLQNFVEDTGVSLNWAKLLEKIDPNILRMWGGEPERSSWHRKPRKLGAFPDLLLPVPRVEEIRDFGKKKTVFMALDTSGSIGNDTANYFINLARSVAKTRLHLEVVTFSDGVLELDLENPTFASGGTSFGPIERWIQNKIIPKYKDKYPHNVIVITDGHASFDQYPPDEYKDRWLWLMTNDGIDPSTMETQFFGKADYLDTYTKG